MDKGEILIYQNEQGNLKVDVQLEDETVWLSKEQMGLLFSKGRSTIAEHISNIYQENELEQNRTCRKFRQVRMEGNRNIERNIDCFNLDVIISVTPKSLTALLNAKLSASVPPDVNTISEAVTLK